MRAPLKKLYGSRFCTGTPLAYAGSPTGRACPRLAASCSQRSCPRARQTAQAALAAAVRGAGATVPQALGVSPPRGAAAARLAENAVRQALAELTAARGAPFPPCARNLTVGRPRR